MVPAFVGLWFDGGASAGRPPAAAAVFIAAAVTDWADGYLARRVRVRGVNGGERGQGGEEIGASGWDPLFSLTPLPLFFF